MNFKDSNLVLSLVAVFFLCFGQALWGQQTPFPPPNQLQVYGIQELNFGAIITGNSTGTVTITPSGSRNSTGSVVLVGSNYFQAIFEVKLIPGRLVHIDLGGTYTLTRVGGGDSMEMQLSTDRGNSFVTTGGHPFINRVNVGGTLNVGSSAANPAGSYEGQFSVTFIQE